jgi:hypothetical protein
VEALVSLLTAKERTVIPRAEHKGSDSMQALVNKLLAHRRKSLVSDWDIDYWYGHEFSFNGRIYPLFAHRFNCGWPPRRMTERSVELALADAWLQQIERRAEPQDVWEIGAVTPYYWPKRVPNVVDPYDSHPFANIRQSLFDISLTGRSVLSISTFEHIGVAEYGQQERPGLAIAAIEKLFLEASSFMVTVPIGYNQSLDDFLFSGVAQPAEIGFLMRPARGNSWRQVGSLEASKATYGPRAYDNPAGWANGLVILERALPQGV